MRKAHLLALMTVLSLAAVACGGDDATTPGAGDATSPGTSPQATSTINNQGQLDATGMPSFSIELGDNYFKPTFIKGTPGQALNIELENEGANPHTFTIASLNIDHQVAAGQKLEINLTLPQGGSADVAFVCRFHEALGMRGAFFFGAAPSASGPATETRY